MTVYQLRFEDIFHYVWVSKAYIEHLHVKHNVKNRVAFRMYKTGEASNNNQKKKSKTSDRVSER